MRSLNRSVIVDFDPDPCIGAVHGDSEFAAQARGRVVDRIRRQLASQQGRVIGSRTFVKDTPDEIPRMPDLITRTSEDAHFRPGRYHRDHAAADRPVPEHARQATRARRSNARSDVPPAFARDRRNIKNFQPCPRHDGHESRPPTVI
jgi:hypothetical protein